MGDQKTSILILSSSHTIETAFRISELVNSYTGENLCRICRDIQDVQAARLEASGHCCGAVLLAADDQELDRWVKMAPMLDDLAVMVRVPDSQHRTIAKAHRLRPRYLMTRDINYGELLTVIGGILARHRIPAALQEDIHIGAWGLPQPVFLTESL